MKRLVFGLSLLLAASCQPKPQQQPTTQINVPGATTTIPPSTPATPVVVTMTELQTQLTAVSADISKLRTEIATSQNNFQAQMDEAIKKATAPIGQLRSSVQKTNAEIKTLQEQFAQEQKAYEERLASIESKQKMLSELQTQLQQAQSEYDAKLKQLSADIGRIDALAVRSSENADLAILALDSMGDKKVGGFLGINRKHLLSDEMQQRLNNRALTLTNQHTVQIKH